ncbi:MAG: queuosine precursor transporter [Bacteroidetes bacterium]|nr:queuosine precursor transporter [Bacteroidota bacterium]
MKTDEQRRRNLFLFMGAFFLCNALIAEFIGVKIFSAEASIGIEPMNFKILGQELNFNMTAGVLLWPVVFVMTDLINEYFGQKGVRYFSFMTAGLIAYAFLMVSLAIWTSPADFWKIKQLENGTLDMNAAYNSVFGQGLWIIIGSLVAFLIGQVVDVMVFHALKRKTGEKSIWLRATGSTLVSQIIDSFVVLYIAFYIGKLNTPDQWPISLVLGVCVVNYIYKGAMAILLTPALYIAHYFIDRYLGIELSEKMRAEAMEN